MSSEGDGDDGFQLEGERDLSTPRERNNGHMSLDPMAPPFEPCAGGANAFVNTSTSSSGVSMEMMEKILECALCLSTICEPISIACGHSFCRVCLVKSLRRSKKKCPSCRSVCHVMAEDAPENLMLKELAMTLNRDAYAMRLAECEAEKASWSTLLPIFYYNDCLFPGSRLSLHLFEPRYRVMMQRVVNTSRSFAYVPNFTDYRANIGDPALVAQLEEVEFMADGRCILEAKLTSRHIIVDHYIEEGTQGLHFCRLQKLEDDSMVDDPVKLNRCVELMQVSRLLTDALIEGPMRARIEQRYGAPPTSPEPFSLWLCQIAPLRDSDKMRLLKSTDTLLRLEAAGDALKNLNVSDFSRHHDMWNLSSHLYDFNVFAFLTRFLFSFFSFLVTVFGEVVQSMRFANVPSSTQAHGDEDGDGDDNAEDADDAGQDNELVPGDIQGSSDGLSENGLSSSEIADAEAD